MTRRRSILIAAVAVLALAAAGTVVYFSTREDPGVTACRAMATKDTNYLKERGDTRAERITALRSDFADSDIPGIRSNGVKVVDLLRQVAAVPDSPESGLATLPFAAPLAESYAGLAGACAAEGVELPPMSE